MPASRLKSLTKNQTEETPLGRKLGELANLIADRLLGSKTPLPMDLPDMVAAFRALVAYHGISTKLGPKFREETNTFDVYRSYVAEEEEDDLEDDSGTGSGTGQPATNGGTSGSSGERGFSGTHSSPGVKGSGPAVD